VRPASWALTSFHVVLSALPESDPYRDELARYIREVVPAHAAALAASVATASMLPASGEPVG
jgi:hypothetical protein